MFAGVLNMSISYLYATQGSHGSNRATVGNSCDEPCREGEEHRAQPTIHTPWLLFLPGTQSIHIGSCKLSV